TSCPAVNSGRALSGSVGGWSSSSPAQLTTLSKPIRLHRLLYSPKRSWYPFAAANKPTAPVAIRIVAAMAAALASQLGPGGTGRGGGPTCSPRIFFCQYGLSLAQTPT